MRVMGKYMSFYIKLFFSVIFVAFSFSAYATNCTTTVGTKVYTFNTSFTSSNNTVGYTTPWNAQSASGTYAISGGCIGNKSTYYTGTPGPGLTQASSDSDGTTWYNIPDNDYLEVATQIYTQNLKSGAGYNNVPFTDLQNYCGVNGTCGSTLSSGSKVKLRLRIKRKFVGASFIVNQTVAYLYGNQGGAGLGTGTPMVQLDLNATMTVPQSCTINAGNTVEFDFGTLSAQSFSEAGAGQKPAGANTITKNVGIVCNNIAAQTTMTLRLEATKVSGNAVVSSNSDVGFILANASGTELTPNTLSSNIPFTLDSDDSANVNLMSWPVSITGNQPTAGTATATGYLRVDFQ